MKLRELLPARKLTVIFSCAVAERENLVPNGGSGSWLADRKLIRSFDEQGFKLVKAIYDRHCGVRSLSMPAPAPRFSDFVPKEHDPARNYVIGNYYFEG
jgi:hypothetical protein